MPAILDWTVDERRSCTIIAVDGQVDLNDSWRFRQAMLKCLAEQPPALLIDLAKMIFEDDTVLALFTALTRQAAQWPGTPVLLCAPPPAAAVLLARGRFGALAVHPSVDNALEALAVGQVVVPIFSDHLLPVFSAPGRGRALVNEACAAWNLPALLDPATLVVSELVANSVEHARTALTAQVTLRSRYLHIAVRDESPNPPVPAAAAAGLAQRGRGLRLVEAESVHWGWLPTRDGKVVWAALAAER